MVPKQEEAQLPCYGGGSSARHDSRIMPVFRAKDRRLSQVVKGEASASRWKVEADVFTILGWLQDRFVRYANVSLTSRHKNPEKVRFGVLACDWNIVPPVTRTRPSVKSAGKRRLKRSQGQTRVSVGRRPRRFQPLSKPDLASRSLNDAEAARVLGSDSRNEVRGPTRDNTGASAQADKRGEVSIFEFGAGPVSAFDFTFRQPHGSLAPWSGL